MGDFLSDTLPTTEGEDFARTFSCFARPAIEHCSSVSSFSSHSSKQASTIQFMNARSGAIGFEDPGRCEIFSSMESTLPRAWTRNFENETCLTNAKETERHHFGSQNEFVLRNRGENY